MHVGIARDALHVAERLLHRLAERDADVFGGVVMIDVQVALGLDRDVDARVPRQQIEHVVEEADAGRDRRTPLPVEIDFDLDVGFLGLALHGGFAHRHALWSRAFYQGLPDLPPPSRPVCKRRAPCLDDRRLQGLTRMASNEPPFWHGTTILTVRKGGSVVIGGDGQVSIGQTIVKSNAKKVRKLGKGDVIGGFAGATADAFTLFERLESQARAVSRAVAARRGRARQGLAHRPLSAPARGHDDRRRQAGLAGLTGTGDVLEPEAGVAGIGSGGNYALAAARALLDGPLDAEEIVRKSLDIAADICVYTNRNVTIESLKS